MLLDFSLRPILVVPHEVPEHLVVRTLGTAVVSGLVSRQEYSSDKPSAKVVTEQVSPGVELPRGRSLCLETRLPPMKPLTKTVEVRVVERGLPVSRFAEEPIGAILPNPYEVATAYRDMTTNTSGTWRLIVQMQQRPTGTWLVSIRQYEGTDLVSIAIPKLTHGKLHKSDYPLAKYIQGVGKPENAWDRLVGEESEDAG